MEYNDVIKQIFLQVAGEPTDEMGTNIYFFTLQRFGPSPSLNFKSN